MNPKTKEFIEKEINKLVDEFSFENQKEKNLQHCPCFEKGKPCHDISVEEMNCFLCYCPFYDNSIAQGGCKIKSAKGKWFFHENLPRGKIWDCSDCDYPHKKEVVKEHLKKIFTQ